MRWTGWLFDNLGLKLFALLLAVVLYLHVWTDRTVEETLYFPVTIDGLGDSLALASMPPSSVGVRVRGTGKQLLRLRYLRPPVKFSLAGVPAGTFQRALTPADVPLVGAEDVTVLSVTDPVQVQLQIERRGARSVHVEVPVSGQPSAGLVALDPVVKPANVQLSGPSAWVARQETLRTEPVSIAGRRDTLELVQPIVPPPGWARAEPGSVLVFIPIEPVASKTLAIPIEVRGIRSELRAEVKPEAITGAWRGPRSGLGDVDARDYSAVVDADRRGRGSYVLPVLVRGPNLDRLAVEPESVRVVLH